MGDREIIKWLFYQFYMDGLDLENFEFEDYLNDGETVQFFRENGTTKASYDKYCKLYNDDGLDEDDWNYINEMCN